MKNIFGKYLLLAYGIGFEILTLPIINIFQTKYVSELILFQQSTYLCFQINTGLDNTINKKSLPNFYVSRE